MTAVAPDDRTSGHDGRPEEKADPQNDGEGEQHPGERAHQVSGAGPSLTQLLLAQVGNYLIGVDTGTATSAPISQATLDSMATWLASLARSL